MNTKLKTVLALVALMPALHQGGLRAQQPQPGILTPRQIGTVERSAISRVVAQRFQTRLPASAEFRGTGAYRFASTDSLHYMDRTDLGSIAFENEQYGTGTTRFDTTITARNDLMKRVDAALALGSLRPAGRVFAGFQDEFAGATRPRGLSIEIDPRTVSHQVARTAEYRRVQDGVPVFGSELLIGFMPDGRIGRFRMHWPQISAAVLRQARDLQGAVREKRWPVPQQVRGSEFEILEVTAGVGHSGFADPRFKIEPVVRVLYRKVGKDPQYPLSSTGYKYFDPSGREVLFSAFPAIPGTTRKPEAPTRE